MIDVDLKENVNFVITGIRHPTDVRSGKNEKIIALITFEVSNRKPASRGVLHFQES